ncbi:MAG: BREX-1 system phosphatase PglZ type B, partial [Candidatus Polarisedimenticolia bacterium]
MTVLDALVEALRGATRHAAGSDAPPVALLWPDPDGEWRQLVAPLRAALPELFVLGPYAPDDRQGPVIWLKCVVDRALPGLALPDDSVPVLYLPGVGRQELRAGDACPAEFQPLIELQYRGATWHQSNGREWTIEAFLGSTHGLGLDIAGDRPTADALRRALPLVAATSVEALTGRRLEAEDFDRLAVDDPPRDLLSWIGQPERFRSACEAARWATFLDVCRRQFGFDPEEDGPEEAASRLAHGGDRWDDVWRRYAEAPRLYPGVAERLGGVQPKDLLVDQTRLPASNDAEERALATALGEIVALGHGAACDRVLVLEREHGPRRAGVWARLGRSPL